MDAGIYRTVFIGKSCAGINSLKIFVAALISFIASEYRIFDSRAIFLLTLGIIVAYVSNLLRMLIIVLIGHYWGLNLMLLVHEYAGWIIFTFWVFMFFLLVNTIYEKEEIV